MIPNIMVRVFVLKKTAIVVIQVLLILLFTYASISKLMDYNNFKFQLGRSPYVTNMSGFVAWALPLVELVTAALLTFEPTVRVGLYFSFFLMVLFTGYIYAMLHYSYFVPCSCGGILSNLDWHSHFIFNMFFTALSLIGIFLIHRKSKTPI